MGGIDRSSPSVVEYTMIFPGEPEPVSEIAPETVSDLDRELMLTPFDVTILNYIKEIRKEYCGYMRPSKLCSRIRKVCNGPRFDSKIFLPILKKLTFLGLIRRKGSASKFKAFDE